MLGHDEKDYVMLRSSNMPSVDICFILIGLAGVDIGGCELLLRHDHVGNRHG